MRSEIVVGLDVGTTKVCAMAAEVSGEGARVLGMGLSPSTGLRKGVVINIDATVESIRGAVKEAEAAAGVRIKTVTAGISGGHIKGFESTGAVGIRRAEVTRADIGRAVDSAKTVYIPLDREVLHVIPTEFVLDGQEGIADPLGMSGVRLESKVTIITGAVSSIHNLLKCCEKAGLDVADLVFEPIAAARSTLTAEERELGVVLVDIGGGTSDIALFREGSMRQTSVLAVGGNHFTNDIAVGFRVTTSEAERIKKSAGAAFPEAVRAAEEIQITQAGGQARMIPRKYLIEVLQPRCDELLELIKQEIRMFCGYESAVCGVVLTGGASRLNGFDRAAEVSLGLPVRLGLPLNIKGLGAAVQGPEYATGLGLATYGYGPEMPGISGPETVHGVFGRMKELARSLIRNADHLNFNTRKEGGILCLKSRK